MFPVHCDHAPRIRLLTVAPFPAIVTPSGPARRRRCGGGRGTIAMEGSQGMSKRVLLIEDEPNIIEAIRFILSRDGWVVEVHSDGASALQTVRAKAPDMVILDVMLPNRSGYDILQDLRADADLANLPVLMLTARGQKKDREMAEQLGASRFMTKPFSNSEMLGSVRELMGVA